MMSGSSKLTTGMDVTVAHSFVSLLGGFPISSTSRTGTTWWPPPPLTGAKAVHAESVLECVSTLHIVEHRVQLVVDHEEFVVAGSSEQAGFSVVHLESRGGSRVQGRQRGGAGHVEELMRF